MSKGYLKDKIASYLGGSKNKASFENFNINEIELEEGKKFINGKDEAENSSQNKNLITQNVTNLNEAFEAVELDEDHHFMHFIINESFKRFESQQYEKLTKIIHDNQVTAFQNESDGTFCIVWKKTKKEIYAVNISERNNIEKKDLKSLCKYILEFLTESLQNDHSGLPSGKKIPTNKFNIDLPSLTDTDGLNLLLHAAANGHTKIIPILLQIAFNVNMTHNYNSAGDYALSYEHYETLLELLKHNSAFPFAFKIENCQNDELKAFVKMTEEFHEHILASNLEEIRKILTKNPKLRYFYDISNHSASAVALKNKNFEVYELLLQNNIFLSSTEDIDDQTENLNVQEKRIIREIHFNNKKDIHEPHLFELLKKSSVGHDDENVQERLNNVLRAFQELNKFPMIQILLKIAALLPNLQIVFDFNRDSVEYLDPTVNRSTLGLFYANGRVYVGAKQLLSPLRQNEVFATIAHELCHFVLFSVFGNMAKPYKDGDEMTETEFEAISVECEINKDFDDIISAVYDYYPPERFHAELIVRIPHFYAHYYDQLDKIETLKVIYKSLFDFYELNLKPKLEISLKILEKKAKNKQNARNKKIVIIALIIVLIFTAFVGCIGMWWIFKPTYKWSKLDDEQKIKVFNASVEFEGVEAKFNEIYGQNDTTNGVFDKLTSDQIKILLNDDILDLNEAQNKFLQEEIFLFYQNLTEKFKEKVQNSSIFFQGQSVVIKSVLGNKTEKILQTLNSTQIVDLIKDKKSIKFGKEILKSTKFHIQRKFQDKSIENPPAKLSSDLFDEPEVKKVILLSDNAGNGKTTTFKHLAWEWKQKYPQKWIQYVDLKSKIQIYQKYQNKNFDLKQILSEIFDLNNLNFDVFEILFDEQNFVILWDGFDEISPTYSDFILKLIKNIKNQTQNIQFLSTRPHYEKFIKEFLNCSVYKLKSLTKDENEEFLNKFYDSKSLTKNQIQKAKKKGQETIWKVQEDVCEAPKDYVESPLMLEMISEVSISDDENFDGTNLYTIYDSFIDAKIKLTDEKGEIVKNEKNQNIRKGLNLDEIFQYFAVKSFLYKLEILNKYENQTHDLDFLSRYGILIFDSDGRAQFVHRTFAEFFLAQYLVKNLNSETDCDEINKNLNEIIDCTVYKDNPKVEEFISGYSAKFKSGKINQKLLFCFKNHSEMKKLFYKVFYDDWSNFDQVIKLFDIFPFMSESLEILWHINDDKTFFSEIAAIEPKIFVENFDKIQEIVTKYFPNDEQKQKKLLFGRFQRGSYLYAIHDNIFSKKFDNYEYLKLLNLSFDFDLNELKNLKIFDFYEFVKSYLSVEEIREMFETHFVDILHYGGLKIWKEIETKFTPKELQELIYESRFKGESLLNYVKDFNVMKLILDFLDGTPNARFIKFIQKGNILSFYKESIMLDDNFEYIWNVIENRTTKDERKNILQLELINDESPFGSFIIFDASIEFGTVEKFELVKNIYEKHFNLTEMRKFSEEYFKIGRDRSDPWHLKFETAEVFVKYLKSLFTIDEIKSELKKSLEELHEFFSERENLDDSYPFFSLLKELNVNKEFEIFLTSQDNDGEENLLFSEMNAKSSNFLQSNEIMKLNMSYSDTRDFFKANFIKIIIEDGLEMWNEMESKLTHEEMQELIYESRFEGWPLLYYVRDFSVTKLIFQTLEGTKDSRFVKSLQYKHNLLLYKESIMSDDNFEYFWNVIETRTTKDERKKILELNLLNDDAPHGLNIFDASIEFGKVEKFELVKNIYEHHFNSAEKMREFCESYFEINRKSEYPWHPNVQTTEVFSEYLKSLFTSDEIESKFKESLEELYKLYGVRENLDFSFPLFSLTNKDSYVDNKFDYSSLFFTPSNMDPNELPDDLKLPEFFEIIKQHLSVDEIREYLKTNFIKIIMYGGLEMWNEIEKKFSREELQELIYESRFKNRSLLGYVRDFSLIKLFFETLDDTKDPRFVKFLQNDDILLFSKEFLMLDDNFEYIWNVIKNRTTKDERKKILQLELINDESPFGSFIIFDASIEFGTVEKFELVKNIYEKHFNLTEVRKFSEEYFQIWREENDRWHPKVKTARAFVKYLKELFTIDEIKNKFVKPLKRLYQLYSERENLDSSYPLFKLLKNLKTVKEFEIFRLSHEFIKEWKTHLYPDDISSLFDVIPTDLNLNELSKISTFSEFYDLIKPHLSDDEVREYLMKNFIKTITIGDFKMWNEIESKFTLKELQELIYESGFREEYLLYYVRDFNLIKLIFKTLEDTKDSRFVKFIQDDKFLNLEKESLMLDDNFEYFWNVILNRITKDERKKILELKLLNDDAPYYLNIFDASIELGTVEKFELVKNIYEQNFNSTEKMRKFCEKYFEIERKFEYSWHPKVETAEAFINYLKSLFSIDEIKSKFKWRLKELHEFYCERENLDDFYPLFSLLKEL